MKLSHKGRKIRTYHKQMIVSSAFRLYETMMIALPSIERHIEKAKAISASLNENDREAAHSIVIGLIDLIETFDAISKDLDLLEKHGEIKP